MRQFLYRFFADQRGLTSIEYGLIVMALSLALMTAYFFMGEYIESVFLAVSSQMQQAQSGVSG